ncbi:hypothetical protein ZIOFF_017971 [Zingiber officinale]|uniref:Uncharacterized protein n=1 Tax=Zingiber officinale TaxID=94328 RepID=A0A8J5H7K8_ZINOF|nr:hypothetical protein ZIOFF_017971 [Zingiber officinale]
MSLSMDSLAGLDFDIMNCRRLVSDRASRARSFIVLEVEKLGSSSKIGLFPPPRDRSVRLLLPPPNALAPARGAETFDPELRLVFELATDAELVELEHILFGPSAFRSVLHIGYMQKLVNEASLGALKGGAKEIQNVFVKGCGILTMARIFQLLARKFSGKLLLEVANYEIKHEIVKKVHTSRSLWYMLVCVGGQLAAIKLEAKTAELIARQGLARAATRYAGIRSAMMLLGPIMWGTFLADVAIQMLGTDYARILRAIYAFAQNRRPGLQNSLDRAVRSGKIPTGQADRGLQVAVPLKQIRPHLRLCFEAYLGGLFRRIQRSNRELH